MEQETAPLDIEMIYDPVAEAHYEGLVIDASRHRIMPDGDFILWARRHYKRPTLFEYHHLETDNIVLCDWLMRGRVAQELEAYEYGNRPNREFLDSRIVLCQEAADSIRRMMRRKSDAKAREREEALAQRTDVAKHYKRKGYDEIAHSINSQAYVPQSQGGEEMGQMVEDLRRITSGRIITHG
jgi:hypothetical protein